MYHQGWIFHFQGDNHDLNSQVNEHDHPGKNLDTQKFVGCLLDALCHEIHSFKNKTTTKAKLYYFIKYLVSYEFRCPMYCHPRGNFYIKVIILDIN